MQKIILLLPLVCLVFCTAQDSLETQNLIYNNTHPVNDVKRVSGGSPYPCPIGYVYLARDFQIFNGVVCVHTTITDVELQQGDCRPGWATISYQDLIGYTPKYCKLLGPRDVARIGFMGSMFGDCLFEDFDFTTSIITHSLCAKRMIDDVKLVPLTDDICEEGMVLVTPQEALANQDTYCNLIRGNDVVRLADGGAMYGTIYSGEKGCKILYEERNAQGAALCRAIKNNEPNENQEMVIPEATSNVEQSFLGINPGFAP